jgi:hypothetical protein
VLGLWIVGPLDCWDLPDSIGVDCGCSCGMGCDNFFVGDGVCNDEGNTSLFNYDGGDCCLNCFQLDCLGCYSYHHILWSQ